MSTSLTTRRISPPSHFLAVAAALLVAGLAFWTGCATTPVDTSQEGLMQAMQSPSPDIAADAMLRWEKTYPTSTNAFGIMRGLLGDDRPKVRRKAARVLGVLHAEVSEQDIQAICAMLKSPDAMEQTDALKALRGLEAPSAIDSILPLLNSPNTHIIRDACRTLAILGGPDLIPKLEPLLSHAEPAVQNDAQNAIFTLRGKST